MCLASIFAGWLVDGSGGPAKENVILSLHKGAITRVKATAATSPSRSDISDFSHCTLLPGLIDAHVHLFMSGTEDLAERERQLSYGFGNVRSRIASRIRRLAACGVVACRDGGDRHAFTLQYMRGCRHKLPIVRVRVAGAAWHQHGRYGKMIGKAPMASESLAQAVRRNHKGIDHLKIVNSGLNSMLQFGKETAPQFSVPELREAVTTGQQLGLKTMVHANGKKPVEIALKAGGHSIEHGFFMGEENLQRMADQQIFWVPTTVTMAAYREAFHRRRRILKRMAPSNDATIRKVEKMMDGASRNLEHQLDQIRRARELGVPIAVGTDAGSIGVYHGRAVYEEIRLLMTGGFSATEAIQCATLNGARLLGLHGHGIIEPGAAATFIAVTGPPQDLPESLERMEAFFIRGKMVYEETNDDLFG